MSEPFAGDLRDPQEWMREQEQRTALLLAKAEEVKSRLAENTVTQTSPDRVVTVTVNPGGGLTGLSLTPDAERMSHSRLAGLILTTYNQAARKAAGQTVEIMSALVGNESDALDLLRESMPEPVEDGVTRRSPREPGADFDDEDGFQGFRGRGDRS